jgi:hypothetical protein
MLTKKARLLVDAFVILKHEHYFKAQRAAYYASHRTRTTSNKWTTAAEWSLQTTTYAT